MSLLLSGPLPLHVQELIIRVLLIFNETLEPPVTPITQCGQVSGCGHKMLTLLGVAQPCLEIKVVIGNTHPCCKKRDISVSGPQLSSPGEGGAHGAAEGGAQLTFLSW